MPLVSSRPPENRPELIKNGSLKKKQKLIPSCCTQQGHHLILVFKFLGSFLYDWISKNNILVKLKND